MCRQIDSCRCFLDAAEFLGGWKWSDIQYSFDVMCASSHDVGVRNENSNWRGSHKMFEMTLCRYSRFNLSAHLTLIIQFFSRRWHKEASQHELFLPIWMFRWFRFCVIFISTNYMCRGRAESLSMREYSIHFHMQIFSSQGKHTWWHVVKCSKHVIALSLTQMHRQR